MFEGFESAVVDVGDTSIFIRRGGQGPPLLLLHGFPETHLMWHRVAPLLAERFTVVCADLRGYGSSGKPRSRSDHSPYSKREMALDMVRVMRKQGFERFGVVGHDRGARVAYRLALDHAERVEQLAVLDIIPTSDAFARADARFALAFWPWTLLAQPAPLPESLIAGAPHAVVSDALSNWGSDAAAFPQEIRAAYVAALSEPASFTRSARNIVRLQHSTSIWTEKIASRADASVARCSCSGAPAARSTPGIRTSVAR